MTIIRPSTFRNLDNEVMGSVCALTKIVYLLREQINKGDDPNDDDPMSGVDFLIECIQKRLEVVSNELQCIENWAKDSNINIEHRFSFGNINRIIDHNTMMITDIKNTGMAEYLKVA